MRKHNKRFARRWSRDKGDRSNFPQSMAHGLVHKSVQLFANYRLQSLLVRAGLA